MFLRCCWWKERSRLTLREKARADGRPRESPAGTTDNSPAIHRWERSRRTESPEGTKELHASGGGEARRELCLLILAVLGALAARLGFSFSQRPVNQVLLFTPRALADGARVEQGDADGGERGSEAKKTTRNLFLRKNTGSGSRWLLPNYYQCSRAI